MTVGDVIVDVGGSTHVRFESVLAVPHPRAREGKGEKKEGRTTTTHDHHAKIEPPRLTTFVPDVDDEPAGRVEDVLPTHHARREHECGWGCTTRYRDRGGDGAAGSRLRLHGVVNQACPVGVVSARTRPRRAAIQFDVVDDGRCLPSLKRVFGF